jgi:hypothetical protein
MISAERSCAASLSGEPRRASPGADPKDAEVAALFRLVGRELFEGSNPGRGFRLRLRVARVPEERLFQAILVIALEGRLRLVVDVIRR